MSQIDDFDYEDDDIVDRNPLRSVNKKLEKELAALRKEREELLAAKRENAFIKAGIDPNDAKFKYFVKGYDGELTPDAIREAGIEAQLIAPPSPVSASADEQAAWNRTAKVAAGANAAQAPVDWNARINAAESPAEVEAIMAEARAALG
jgi:hypothetical protein